MLNYSINLLLILLMLETHTHTHTHKLWILLDTWLTHILTYPGKKNILNKLKSRCEHL